MKRSLTKQEILRKKSEISLVFHSPEQYSVKGMKLYMRANEGRGNRVLVSLVRSYGNAIERNYARRIGKEIFRSHKDTLTNDHDLVFVMYPGAFGYTDREKQILSLLRRAHVLV